MKTHPWVDTDTSLILLKMFLFNWTIPETSNEKCQSHHITDFPVIVQDVIWSQARLFKGYIVETELTVWSLPLMVWNDNSVISFLLGFIF